MASNRPDMTWDYDEASDVLYISFGTPRPACGEHIDEDIVIRRSPEDNEVVGITVIGFKAMGGVDALLQRLKNFVGGLRVPLLDEHADELRQTTASGAVGG